MRAMCAAQPTIFIRALLCAAALGATAPAAAQTSSALGDSAKGLIGTWEFSNAERDKACSITFKPDATKVGFKVDFDKACGDLFPIVTDVAGWTFPDNDLLRLLDAQGKVLIEFSEVEDGIYEAPTPGLGVLFLQNAASAGPPPKRAEQVAGSWAITRADTTPICLLTLSPAAAKDGYALTVEPGCDATIARLNLGLWRLDRDELMLAPARGNAWRFEEIESGTWRRVPESADPMFLRKQ